MFNCCYTPWSMPMYSNYSFMGSSYLGGGYMGSMMGRGSIWSMMSRCYYASPMMTMGCCGYNPWYGAIWATAFKYNAIANCITSFGNLVSTIANTTRASRKPIAAPVTNNTQADKDLRTGFVSNAQKYMDYDETNGGYKTFAQKFKDGTYSKEWCCDFVSYVVKETYNSQGKTVPSGFGCHRVQDMKKWAIKNNRFLSTSQLGKADRKETISNKVNVGDLLVLNDNGASHIAIVTDIDKTNGKIKTIEGNRDDKVTTFEYDFNDPGLSGFVQLNA